MSGEFTLEDKSGNIVFASSPGMSGGTSNKSDVKKSKASGKKTLRRPPIQIFLDLAEEESDVYWEKRFNKMALSSFPPKLSWVNGVEDNVYGEILYKNRQIIKTFVLYRSDDLDQIRVQVKAFIQNYTNIEPEEEETGDSVIRIEKRRIDPVIWSRLTPKDQTSALVEYVKAYSLENSLSPEDGEQLIRYLVVFAMGKKITPYLSFDATGAIQRIAGILKGKEGYRLRSL